MPTRRPGVVVAAALALFVGLTVLVAAGVLDSLDNAVWHFVDRHDSAAGVMAARVLTDLLQPPVDALVLLAGGIVLALRERRWRPLAVAVAVLVVVSAVVLGLKYGIDRPLPHSHGVGRRGFPSGHTAATACFLGTLAVLLSVGRERMRRRLLGVVALLTLLVVVALVYAGYHWLTDTLASLALSVAVLATLGRETFWRVSPTPERMREHTLVRSRRPPRP